MPSDADRPRAVVLADGDFPTGPVAAALLGNARSVVCCDGAAGNLVAHGGAPAAVVGDCDSLAPELRTRFAGILHCDSDQETNDLTKAVRYCAAHGMHEIVILGATGKREDHMLGNISLLVDYMLDGLSVRMVTDHGVFDPIAGEAFFESFPGQQVSIFALSPQTLVTTVDLMYPLRDAPLPGWWRGTLNQALGHRFGFRTTGPAIVFRVFQ